MWARTSHPCRIDSPGNRHVPTNAQPSPPKPARNSPKARLLNLRKEEIMLVRQPFVIPPDLLDNTMLTGAQRASSLILKETSTFGSGDLSEPHIVEGRKNQSDIPLMVAMIAHKVYARKIELTITLRAPRDVEYSRMLCVLEILDLLQLRLRL